MTQPIEKEVPWRIFELANKPSEGVVTTLYPRIQKPERVR